MKLLHKLFGRSDIIVNGETYMKRWLIPQEWLPKSWSHRLPGIRLHNVRRSDEDRALHDHPWNFVSIVLRGGYYEHLDDGTRTWHGPGSILFRKAETLHRLELPSAIWRFPDGQEYLHVAPAWTLVFRAPARRPWGFMTSDGWVHWKKFTGAGRES